MFSFKSVWGWFGERKLGIISLLLQFNLNLLRREPKSNIMQFIKRERRTFTAPDRLLCPCGAGATNAESFSATPPGQSWWPLYRELSRSFKSRCRPHKRPAAARRTPVLLLVGEKKTADTRPADSRPAAVDRTIADNSLQDLVDAEAIFTGTNGSSASEIDASHLHLFSDTTSNVCGEI